MSELAHPIVALVVVAIVIACAAVIIIALIYGRRMDTRIGRIHFEVKPNHGTSLKDAVMRLERNMVTVAEHVGVAIETPPPPALGDPS